MMNLGDVRLHYRVEGDPNGAPIVFANSLGTDYRLWDKIIPLLPAGLRILRFDKRGHGLSSCPQGDYNIDELVADTARLMQALDFKDCLFVGLSIGGLIAQGLAALHPELLRVMVISNTAAKIGTPGMWQQRIDALRDGGIEALADGTMDRWFSRRFLAQQEDELEGWRNMLIRTPVAGFRACCVAISASDFTESNKKLSLPTLAIGGSEDGSTPPELMRATADLISGSRLEIIDDAGHLPCVEKPERYAALLNDFIRETGHV